MNAREAIRRFWDKVEKTSRCWIWHGAVEPNGYGVVTRGGRNVRAHRYAWKISKGPIPDGLFVLHRCDYRICVRPAHLWLGTQADNMRDMVAKGRMWTHVHPERRAFGRRNGMHTHPETRMNGSSHHQAKLTEKLVKEIRMLRQNGGWTERALGTKFGLSHSSIGRILRRQNWTHI